MLILKGIIIGMGKIIPGVSGSLLAISMGVYQQIIDSINNFFSNPKYNIKFLFKIGFGVLISIILFSNIIIKCLNKYYIITMFFFIGLIIGSLDEFKSNLNSKNYIVTFFVFAIVLVLGFLNIKNDFNISNSFLHFLFYILVGFIDAVTMVIPGISGTATLMMIGAYNSLITCFSNLINISLFYTNMKVLIPFSIGLFIGIIFTAKLVEYLFKNYKSNTNAAILGFSISTIVLMGITCINTNYDLISLILAFLCLFLGVFIIKKINHCISD